MRTVDEFVDPAFSSNLASVTGLAYILSNATVSTTNGAAAPL